MRQLLAPVAVVIMLAGVPPCPANAAGIAELPGLVQASVCFWTPTRASCGGASQAQLAAPPYYFDTLVEFGATGYVGVGLSDRMAQWGGNDGEYLLGLSLPAGSPRTYPLDAIFLQFDLDQPSRWVSPNAIVFADVVFAPGFGPDDLSRLFEPYSGVLPENPVVLESGFLVFSFSAIPEPGTALLVMTGALGLAATRRRCAY